MISLPGRDGEILSLAIGRQLFLVTIRCLLLFARLMTSGIHSWRYGRGDMALSLVCPGELPAPYWRLRLGLLLGRLTGSASTPKV